MPFVPHTDEEVQTMLKSIGVSSIETLFDEIPASLRITDLKGIPEGLNEMETLRLMKTRAEKDQYRLNFIGAGAYEHHIPAAVWEVASRGEWLTAYTPYQAEASQGTLQLLYEYQTMMANLMAMEVSNASLYDGASALAEAILMAARLLPSQKGGGKPRTKILLPTTLHPAYRQVVKSVLNPHTTASASFPATLEIMDVPYDPATGTISTTALSAYAPEEIIALVVPQPNFFGCLENGDELTDWAHAHNIKLIAQVNPSSMALLKPPGEWGRDQIGADIVCGEGQPLGVPLASGGPYFGFLCCKKEYIRQLPGCLIGRTVDQAGKPGFTLTLQAREQHIRRAKATSNICTNQGLLVTAGTIYLSLLGKEGLQQVALQSANNMQVLKDQLLSIDGVEPVFNSPIFHECVFRFKVPVEKILDTLSKKGIQGGFNLKEYYPELGECLLICATETKQMEDLTQFCTEVNAAIHSKAEKGVVVC